MPILAQQQKVVVSSGEYQMRVERTMTEIQAEKKAIELAQIAAIEKAFGRVVIQGNSTYIQNRISGESIETDNVFNYISDTYVNGEWIEDLSLPDVEKVIADGETWITAKVKGRIRELRSTGSEFVLDPVSCPDLNCKTRKFNNGQDFYIFFKAPANGFLALYLDIPSDNRTYRILPYKQNPSVGSVAIRADQNYVFFSPRDDLLGDPLIVDELVLTLYDDKIPEIHKVFGVFSPERDLDKPMLDNPPASKREQKVLEQNLELPLGLHSEDFQKWLQKLRIRNPEVQLSSIYIDIIP